MGTAVVTLATTIPLDFGILNGWPARLFVGALLACYGGLVVAPASRRLHAWAMAMAWVYWFGRAAVALGRYIGEGDLRLLTVVATSIIIGSIATALHLYVIRAVAAHEAFRVANGP